MKFHRQSIDYDLIEYRFRYIDHVINLLVQLYLFDKYFDVEYYIIIDISQGRKLDNNFQIYRKLDSQRKLHNIIVHIIYFSQRI